MTGPGGQPVRLKEERVTGTGETVLELKNGGRIEARLGLAHHLALDSFLHKDPQHFQALLAIARGRADAVTPEQGTFLRHCLYLRPDGTIEPGLRDVLLSAYQETPEGAVLVNPFRIESPEQLRELERLEDSSYQRLLRWVRPGGSEGPAGGRG